MSQYISGQILLGMARHKGLAYIAAVEGVMNLLLSIFLARKMGVIGVAWGTAIPHLITSGLVIPYYTMRVLRANLFDYIVRGFVRPAICAAPIAAVCYALSLVDVSVSWPLFGAEVIAICVLFFAL